MPNKNIKFGTTKEKILVQQGNERLTIQPRNPKILTETRHNFHCFGLIVRLDTRATKLNINPPKKKLTPYQIADALRCYFI